MKSFRTFIRPSVPVLVLPAAHLVLCIAQQVNPSEGGWNWFLPFVADLPFSGLYFFDVVPPLIFFGIFGTLWWYLISVTVRFFLTWRPYDRAREDSK